MGELGVAVGNMGVLLGERHDDVAEVRQGLVDVLSLGQSKPLAPAVLDPLASREINLEKLS